MTYKKWLSVTPLIDGLTEHEMINIGDTLTIYFKEYGTKTNYPQTWYIKPIAIKIENEAFIQEYTHIIKPKDIQHIFPGFTYLNLTKSESVNPDRIDSVRDSSVRSDNDNQIWRVIIENDHNEFTKDGKTYRYFEIDMYSVPHKKLH